MYSSRSVTRVEAGRDVGLRLLPPLSTAEQFSCLSSPASSPSILVIQQMNVSYSALNNDEPPEDRSCLDQLGSHWHQRTN